MKNLITLASMAVLLAACGGGPLSETGSSSGTSDGGPVAETPDTTPALEYTADLKSSADFDFATSRAIAIDFDVEQARVSEGLMSLCTNYTESDGAYDIDYDSCTVQSPLVDGVYSGQMDVTNDVNSVIGVVWFKDPDIAPVYKEFMLEVGAKVARRGAGPQAIVWR
ncbi:hypothetical protein [Leucothrix pacifica]|uniref:Uncharacterized protein n=1 Tax=Leucothrix pacifica TaxID=1247513 RepID=A0A317CNA8_9GAMM|nr:hypothetical protein [Leucothrix pacifica]PWQ97800.1 hypothetical protein DKW60_09395 [Leucothrix pacifica]